MPSSNQTGTGAVKRRMIPSIVKLADAPLRVVVRREREAFAHANHQPIRQAVVITLGRFRR